MNQKIVVCGAGGYVGSRFVEYLLNEGHTNIRAVSRGPVSHWSASSPRVENLSLDLRDPIQATKAVAGADLVFNMAASVGGIGFVNSNNVKCLANVTINTNLLFSSALEGVSRYFFASSSCVYPGHLETPLKEPDAYPADPMGGYGWEKLFSEKLCLAYARERELPVTIARYHGIYGPGDFRPDGKDHVATALARKVLAASRDGSEVEIWGNGNQTRSLLYIDDCLEGTYRLMMNKVEGPVNLAHPEPISVEGIVDLLEQFSGVPVKRRYNLNAVTGRHHKTSDNWFLRTCLGWEPSTTHYAGLKALYESVLKLPA